MTSRKVLAQSKQISVPSRIVRIRVEPVHTRYIQIKKTGRMDGRTAPVPISSSDKTRVMAMASDYDVNKDNKIDDRDLRGGQIVGRAPPGTPLGTIKSPRYIKVNRYVRKGKSVKDHRRYVK